MKKIVSVMILTLLLVSILTLAHNIQPVKASGTIHIRADGSIDPPTANITTVDNVTYTFTGDIGDSIVVERDNVVVDGASYTLQGIVDITGIDLSYRSNVTIKNTTIKGFSSRPGIRLYSSSNNTICGNNITSNFHGILFNRFSNFNTICGNNITESNGCGIFADSSSNNTICGNNIAGSFWEGISYYSCSNNAICENNITNNGEEGIQLGPGCHFSIISGNKITDNSYGISIDGSNNTVFHNNFVNTVNIETPGHTTFWDNGCEGNYWSDYNGTDSDGDGTGDTPYVIDGNNTDYYPLMNPYWLPGDVNHDLKINIYDVVRITGIYNSQQGDPNWNCHSDIAEPYGIINIYDVVTCTKDYRKEYTP